MSDLDTTDNSCYVCGFGKIKIEKCMFGNLRDYLCDHSINLCHTRCIIILLFLYFNEQEKIYWDRFLFRFHGDNRDILILLFKIVKEREDLNYAKTNDFSKIDFTD